MNLLFINESQGENIGDQAIYDGVKQLLSTNKNLCLSQFQLSLMPIKNINKLDSKYSGISKAKNISFLYGFFLLLRLFVFNLKRLPKAIKVIKKSDLVVFGGGSLLIDNNNVFPINLFFLSIICRVLKTPYGVAGVSTRKIKRKLPLLLLKFFIRHSKFNYFRDANSLELSTTQFDVKAKYVPDFALCLQPHDNMINNNVAINVMGRQKHGFFSTPQNYDKYFNSLLNLITTLNMNEGVKITLFTTGEKVDAESMLNLEQLLKTDYSCIVKSFIPHSLNELESVYEINGIVFATRLHSAIIGLAKGSRVVCFNWDDKVSGLFQSLELKSCLVNIDDDFFIKLNDAKKLSIKQACLYSGFINEIKLYEK